MTAGGEERAGARRVSDIETLMDLCNLEAWEEEEEGERGGEGTAARDAAPPPRPDGSSAGPSAEGGMTFGRVCAETLGIFGELPSTPAAAARASAAFAGATGYIDGGPRLTHLLEAMVRNAFGEQEDRARRGLGLGRGSPLNRFVDLETGIRMRHIAYTGGGGGANASTVLLLHDLGDSAESFAALVSELNLYHLRGRDGAGGGENYRYVGVDLRGHGMSSHSLNHEYTLDAVVNDVVKFIVQRDIYKRRSILVGAGLGAVVAAAAAKCYPRLFSGVAMIDPPSTAPAGNVEALCRFHPYQGAEFASHAHAMQSMLAGYAQLVYAICGGADGAGADAPGGDFRNMDGLARELVRTLRPPPHLSYAPGAGGLRVAMDSEWCMRVSQEQWECCLADMPCATLVIRGGKSHWCTPAGAEHMARIIRGGPEGGGGVLATVDGASHWAVADDPNAVARLLYRFIESLARRDGLSAAADRRPEALGIRPLDQFESIEEAMKRLGPRKIPTQSAIRAALRELTAEERGVGADEVSDDEDEYGNRVTKLAKDDPEYFAFV